MKIERNNSEVISNITIYLDVLANRTPHVISYSGFQSGSGDIKLNVNKVISFNDYSKKENLEKTEPRVADLFKDPQDRYSIWQETNMPQVIQTEKFFQQKNSYIEQNPVRKNYVDDASHWLFSSAHKSNKIYIHALSEL